MDIIEGGEGGDAIEMKRLSWLGHLTHRTRLQMGVFQRGKPLLVGPQPNSLPKPMKTFEDMVRLARDFDRNGPHYVFT